ncbi:hypothetical protein ACIGXA_11205 [Streptomyces fildesensis]|uniref:Uncharacterized protein n=1 Tax=Streptomyces fildesensis TaxID=375757 RepID=A0ABW8C6M0_9ACTN
MAVVVAAAVAVLEPALVPVRNERPPGLGDEVRRPVAGVVRDGRLR